MPRDVPSGLLPVIQSDAWNPAILVKVTRKDSTVQGYTSADIEVVYDGLTYYPDDGMQITPINATLGAGVDNTQASGFMQDARLDESLLNLKAYEGATFETYLCDFTDISLGVMILNSGSIGEISTEDESVKLDMPGLSAYLKRIRADVTTKKCRCRHLGDVCCKLSLAGTVTALGDVSPRNIQSTRAVDSVTSQKIITFASDDAPSSFYTYGYVKFSDGLNSGIEREIKTHNLSSGKAEVETIIPFPYAIAPGDHAVLTAGCNRKHHYDGDATAEPRIGCTCTEFENGVNFHGEHYLPGNDAITKVAGN